MIQKKCLKCGTVCAPDALVCPNDQSGLATVLVGSMIGHQLGNRYTIIDELGRGGMGTIYKAHHARMDRIVAIKLLLANASDNMACARFQVEARAASILSHPNIVRVFEFDITPEGLPYLVMEYLEGQTLGDVLEESLRLPVDKAVPIFIQLCSALEHAHKRNVVHRDLKPSNIMFVEDDDGNERVILLDFGIAKLFAQPGRVERKLTQTGEVFGSPTYMSPEQCMGQPTDAQSDIYSFGCVMYETLTGVPPIAGENFLGLIYAHLNYVPEPFSKVAPDLAIPKELEDIVMRSLQKKAIDRFTDMAQLKKALESFSENFNKTSKQPPPVVESVVAAQTSSETNENSKIDDLLKKAQSGNLDAQCDVGIFYFIGQFVDQDYDRAYYWLKKAADAENMVACYYMGRIYEDGKGTTQNSAQSAHYYKLAAEKGDDISQTILGRYYEDGVGVAQDLDLALYWYQKAAQQDNVSGLMALRYFYKYAVGVEENPEKCAQNTIRAAELGHARAQVYAGQCYKQGYGADCDYEEAATWFLMASQQGDAEGKRELARCYQDGKGVQQDDAEAYRWMHEAASAGDCTAQAQIAYWYGTGQYGLKKDFIAAFKWYSKAALKKDPWSQYQLGNMTFWGDGIKRNESQAIGWYQKAADQGLREAQFQLALCFRDGTGIEQNLPQYEKWLAYAAEKELPEAQFEMGRYHEEDKGDLQRARPWYQKAAKGGNQTAKAKLLQTEFAANSEEK